MSGGTRGVWAVLSAALVLSPAALAADRNYLTAQGAIADVEDLDNGVTGVITAGLAMPQIHHQLALEGEFALSIIEPETAQDRDLSYFTLGGYGAMTIPFNERVALRGRVGLVYQDLEIEQAGADSDFGVSFGVGFTAQLQGQARFIAEITVIESDTRINHFSAGVQFPM